MDLDQLQMLCFDGKGEDYVREKYLTPLLMQLGYELDKDYEVYRSGDKNVDLKLNYPPVACGAKKVKHYKPDYIPTIRKKMFWVIEAKSPSIPFPFEYQYIVQGLQYCIHPEIQAKYLVISNGIHTSIYDPQDAVFNNGNMYEPIFDIQYSELVNRWEEIYNILSVEHMRTRIEAHLISYYEKLCLSSLDERYPFSLATQITKNQQNICLQIRQHVASLHRTMWDSNINKQVSKFSTYSIPELESYIMKTHPVTLHADPSKYYIEKSLQNKSSDALANEIITHWGKYNSFEKEHYCCALCHLFTQSVDTKLKETIKNFLLLNYNKLNLLNQAECYLIRLNRKINYIHQYSKLQCHIKKYLDSQPELIKFVHKVYPDQILQTYEIIQHQNYFPELLKLNDHELQVLNTTLGELEQILENDFKSAITSIPLDERLLEFQDYAYRGLNNRLDSLEWFILHFKILTKDQLKFSS